MNTFFSLFIVHPVAGANLVQNPSFTFGIATWTVNGGADFSVDSSPGFFAEGYLPGYIEWSYKEQGYISQTVQLPPSTASYLFSIEVGGGLFADMEEPDFFSAQASFYDGDGVLLQTIGTAGLPTSKLTLFSWTTTESMIQARTAEISLAGQAGKGMKSEGYNFSEGFNFSSGYYGPIMGNVSLQSFQGSLLEIISNVRNCHNTNVLV